MNVDVGGWEESLDAIGSDDELEYVADDFRWAELFGFFTGWGNRHCQ